MQNKLKKEQKSWTKSLSSRSKMDKNTVNVILFIQRFGVDER